MSWPTWPGAAAPLPAVQSTLVPSAINSAPAVVPPGLQYTQEQWAQLQQQNWQQWAQWQQQYQQWHQQYGAEYQKSITALQGVTPAQQPPLPAMPNTGVPPPLPAEPKPPLPPEEPPINQPSIPSYSTMPPKPVQAGYTTAPPVIGQQMQLPPQTTDQYTTQRQTWQSNQINPNKRPYSQGLETQPNKRPLLDRPPTQQARQWPNNQQQSNINQWTSQPPPNVSYNQPPPKAQPTPKPNSEELSEAEKKFDKEFAAWEAQFNKWKEQNANHPDKTQYLEYEKKWETWRNSLLERREQMRRKRLAMSGVPVGPNKPASFSQVSSVAQPTADISHDPQISAQLPSESPKPPVHTPDLTSKPPNYENSLLPDQNNEPLTFKSSQTSSEETGEGFLKSAVSSAGGIPGLDLVKEGEGNETEKEEVVEIDKEKENEEQSPEKRPDLDAISKGINTILGDQKLLSMLSMVSQNPPSAPATNTATNSVSNISSNFLQEHNFSAPPPPQQFNDGPPNVNFSAPPPMYQHNEGPPPNLPPYNEQSNHSYEERSNHGDNYQQRESVNNFDDQTRSSFTMGPSEQDVGYNNFPRNQLNKPPGNRFGGLPPLDNDRGNLRNNFGSNTAGNFGPHMSDNRNKFGPTAPNMSENRNKFGPNFGTNMPDNRNKFGPNDSYGANVLEDRNKFSKFGAVRPDIGPGSFSKNTNSYNQADSFKPNDPNRRNNFYNEQGPLNRQENFRSDNFSKESGFNKYNDKFGPGNNFRDNIGSGNNFNDRRGNFGNNYNRPNFNEQEYDRFDKDNYDQGNYEDYEENYNEDEDFDKYHEMFNDGDDENQIVPRQPQPQIQEQQLGQRPPPAPQRLMDINVAPPEPVPEEEPIFEPTTVIDYEHKSLRSSEPDVVVEPIHMFDYRHKPLNRIPIPQRPKWLYETVKFIREFDPLASRGSLNFERPPPLERYPLNRDLRRDERRTDILEDRFGPHNRVYDERDRFSNENRRSMDRRSFSREDERFERQQKENNDSYSRRERRSHNRDENFDRENERHEPRFDEDVFSGKKRNDEFKQIGGKDFEDFSDEELNFEDSELKKYQQDRGGRGESRSPIMSNPPNPASREITMIEDIINAPGRFNRPPRIVIILRGPPGSGKTYLAKLIKDKEVENGGSAPRILSLDDYFMVEHEKEVVEDGKKVKVKEMIYEYEAEMEESYRTSFVKSFKKTITDGYFPFIIVDNVNDKVKYFGEMWSFAKQNGFQVYICQLDLDPALCTKRNIHNRSEAEIEECIAGWEPTPNHHPTIDASGFLQSITDVEMEEVEQPTKEETKTEEAPPEDDLRSKWDTFDCSINNLAKLDGISKPLRPSRTMEEYLQMENDWEPAKPTKPGQKRVRWADLEEQRKQKKMRAIGFVVGHTNWNRMMDPTEGSSALTQTKYI